MLQNQKFYIIIAKSGTCTYNAAQAISDCLYAKVMNTLPKIFKNLQKSYDFTNVWFHNGWIPFCHIHVFLAKRHQRSFNYDKIKQKICKPFC